MATTQEMKMPARHVYDLKEIVYKGGGQSRSGNKKYIKKNRKWNDEFINYVHQYYKNTRCTQGHLRRKFKIGSVKALEITMLNHTNVI